MALAVSGLATKNGEAVCLELTMGTDRYVRTCTFYRWVADGIWIRIAQCLLQGPQSLLFVLCCDVLCCAVLKYGWLPLLSISNSTSVHASTPTISTDTCTHQCIHHYWVLLSHAFSLPTFLKFFFFTHSSNFFFSQFCNHFFYLFSLSFRHSFSQIVSTFSYPDGWWATKDLKSADHAPHSHLVTWRPQQTTLITKHLSTIG